VKMWHCDFRILPRYWLDWCSILIDNRIDSNDSCDDIGKSLRTLFARITGSTESITLIGG